MSAGSTTTGRRTAWAGLWALAGAVLLAAGGGGGSTPPATGPTISAACTDKRGVAGYDVVLLIGQSNMSGYGAYIVPGFDTTDPRIQQWTMAGGMALASDPLQHPDAPFNVGRIGPGMSFARAYLAALPTARKVLLVPAAYNGTAFSNRRWNPGDDLFEAAVTRLNAALASDGGNCLAAILWSQGESDVDTMTGAQYQAALDTMIGTLRTRIAAGQGGATVPFLLGQFSPDWIAPAPTPGQQAILDVINGTPGRLRYTAVVSTAGLTSNLTQGLNGAVHLDASSHRIYGRRFYEALPVALANTPR
ncbi:sialate O-acetylesterase [Piscinibacter sakaiensis]|uniref:sialate O-acetylesterase n=1 Tax=Piscinibacter sakaiensis TaxID=1547922 RepID=UPI00372BCA92